MTTFMDANGNALAFETLRGDQMHLYYDCVGLKFELVGSTASLLQHLRTALNAMDLESVVAE